MQGKSKDGFFLTSFSGNFFFKVVFMRKISNEPSKHERERERESSVSSGISPESFLFSISESGNSKKIISVFQMMKIFHERE